MFAVNSGQGLSFYQPAALCSEHDSFVSSFLLKWGMTYGQLVLHHCSGSEESGISATACQKQISSL